MRSAILKRAWRAFRQTHFIPQSRGVIVMVALLLAAASLVAGPVVNTLGGGNPNVKPKFLGYEDGITLSQALFHTPCGLALDITGQYLFVADRDNNAIRYLDLVAGYTWTFEVAYTNLINKPIAVAVDPDYNVYVLNRGNGTNGSVVTFDNWGDVLATNAVRLTNAAGMALDGAGNIYLTVQSNKLIRIIAGTTNWTTIAANFPASTSLQGIVVKHNGLIAACDSGRNGIYLIDPATGIVTTNAGFHGAGDFTTNGNNIASSTTAKFNQPMCVVEAGDGTLIVTDNGNNRVKAVLPSGVVTNLYGVTSKYWGGTYPGWYDGTVSVPDSVAPNVQSRLPFGIVMAPDGSLYTTEDYYHIIRHVTGAGLLPPPPPAPAAPTSLTATTNSSGVLLTWSASVNATNYNVERAMSSGGPYTIIGTTATTSFTDTNVLAGATYYYVVTASNAGGVSGNSPEVSVTIAIPPPLSPEIGWYDFEGNTLTGFFSVLHPVSGGNPYVANNPLLIAINPTTNGVATYYITLPPSTSGAVPSPSNGSTPPVYENNQLYGSPNVNPLPPLALSNGLVTIEAVNVNGVGESSAVASASFLFQVGTPTILGNNAAQFTLTDITTNVIFYYTLDGTDPTNAPASQQVSSTNSTVTLSLNGSSNIFFQVRAYGFGLTAGYAISGIAQQSFMPGNFVPNSISFGFASGEASSVFVASPGQTFYAPVTLTVLPLTVMDSLQFSLTVNSISNSAAITPGAFGFQSMLMMPIPGTSPVIYTNIPPAMFNGTGFTSLEVVTNNSLGVGWLERYEETNLFNTLAQSLITYSIAHDDMFPDAAQPNGVIVGGYTFQVPANAAPGDTYQIQITRPSATTDGIGEPGSSIFIYAPTNGSLTNGAINSVKIVTVGQRKYIAGDAAPFSWFNAGDFGDGILNAPDVAQVFEAAVYGLDTPPPGSDLFDAMDSCGYTFVDNGYGYLQPSATLANEGLLFNGNDATINQIAFGDGKLDVADVYVTFRRSLQTNLVWFRRYWTNDVAHGVSGRVAEIVPNVGPSMAAKSLVVSKSFNAANIGNSPISITNQPKVNFTAGDFQAAPGQSQTIQIPITANIFGSYPLCLLMLNLSVVPLDGSPVLTTPVTFSYNPTLGTPWTTEQRGNGNYSAVWLNSGNSGLSNNATIGTLTVTLPANATSLSAYAIHFDHASASPNGIASFPEQTLTGLITLSSRTNSSYGDGIPDSWRLRWFGTVNNLLSVSNACPSGDGINNWQKYVAGVDPNTPNDFPSLNPATPVPAGATASIYWPSVSGIQYVILRSSSLFPGNWSAIATNTGTGTDMEFIDSASGSAHFYRVQILP